jgi:hypothetical protein
MFMYLLGTHSQNRYVFVFAKRAFAKPDHHPVGWRRTEMAVPNQPKAAASPMSASDSSHLGAESAINTP